MDKLITLLLVIAVMAVLVFLAKNEKPETGEHVNIYRYSRGFIWLFFAGAIFFALLTPWAHYTNRLDGVKDIVGLSSIAVVGLLSWCFFDRSKICMTEWAIVKATPFWTTEIPYNDVIKVVIHRSKANPGAAMTRVYGKKKITLEAMLVGYEELVDELRFRCKNAQIIEK